MSFTVADQFYLKALDDYPYNMESVIENLNYALSYDDEHCQANYLMGCVYMEVLKDFDQAEIFFEQALRSNLTFPDTYKQFSLLKIWKSEFDQAMKLIDYGLTVKGMNKCILLRRRAMVYECTGQLKLAKYVLSEALIYCMDSCTMSEIESDSKRVQKKIKSNKKSMLNRA